MKIIHIAFENIQSLKGKQEIDFQKQPLLDAGLFAIIGPTGAGKSTILDVITLGLFNRIPRFKKNNQENKINENEIERSGSVVTFHMKEAWVEVTYACAKGVFRSRWSIKKNRNDKWSKYEMSIVDVSSNKELPLKRSEVPLKNEQIIGLNYDQFIKSIVLSQGEFAKFLKSSKDDRYKLLEDISGTFLYRSIGQKAYEIWKEKDTHLKELRIRLDTIVFLPKDDRTEMEAHVHELKEKVSSFKQEKDILIKQEKIARTARDVSEMENKIVEHIKIQANRQEKFEEAEKKLNAHQKIQGTYNKYQLYQKTSEQIVELEGQLNQNRINLDAANHQVEAALKNVENLVGMTLSEDSWLEELDQWEAGVLGMQQALSQIEASGRQARKTIKANIEKSTEAIQNNWNKLIKDSDKLDFVNARLLSLKEYTLDHVALSDQLQKKQEYLQLITRAVEGYNRLKEAHAQMIDVEKQIKEIDDKIRLGDKEKQIINDRINAKKVELNAKKQEQDQAIREFNMEAHRTTLKKGHPCPLCGATDHPYTEHLKLLDVGQGTIVIKELENELDALNIKENQNLTKLGQYNGVIRSLKDALYSKQETMQSIQNTIDEISRLWTPLKGKNIEECQDLATEITFEIEQLKAQFEIIQEKMLYESIKPYLEEIVSLGSEYRQGKKALETKYKGQNIRKDVQHTQSVMQKAIQMRSESNTVLNVNKTRKIDLDGEYKILHETLKGAVVAMGYEDFESCFKHYLTDSALKQNRESVKEYNSTQTTIATMQDSIADKRNWLKDQQYVGSSVEDIQEQLKSLEGAIEFHVKTLSTKEEQLRADDELRLKYEEAHKRIEIEQAVISKYELLNRMIGDARGNKFASYAQELTLIRLLVMANIRLEKLTDRYKLVHDTKRQELSVIDFYQGGSQRGVLTLSGGETFILSLALALGLSDLASKMVQLDCLFIDEGFGTLDPETLDMALSTLEQLQYESGKIIGIISHVESLKERISTKIELVKNKQGHSSIQFLST